MAINTFKEERRQPVAPRVAEAMMRYRTFLFWGVMVAVGGGMFFALKQTDSLTSWWVRPAGGLVIIIAALAILYGATPDPEHKIKARVLVIGWMTYGVAQLIPDDWTSAAIMGAAALLIWGAVVQRPKRLFAAPQR